MRDPITSNQFSAYPRARRNRWLDGGASSAKELARRALGRGGDMPEVNNIPPSLSYRLANPAEPVLDISIGDALRAACACRKLDSAILMVKAAKDRS